MENSCGGRRGESGDETFSHSHLVRKSRKWVLVMMGTTSSINRHVPRNQISLRRQGLGSEQNTQAVPHRIKQKPQKKKKKKKIINNYERTGGYGL
jgi:hypothetical protein